MRQCAALWIVFLASIVPATGQVKLPIEAKSQITVLVDLSQSWLNPQSNSVNKRTLEAVAESIGTMLPKLKNPVGIRFLEIGDGSLSRPPICQARYSPNIYHLSRDGEFADIPETIQFLKKCGDHTLSKKPAGYTDITGALNTVSRVSRNESSQYSALIILSDFREERRKGQSGTIGKLPGFRTALIYRVLETDRMNPADLDKRVQNWTQAIRGAGASSAVAMDDVIIEPGTLSRLLLK
jgi:hypothetical protein